MSEISLEMLKIAIQTLKIDRNLISELDKEITNLWIRKKISLDTEMKIKKFLILAEDVLKELEKGGLLKEGDSNGKRI